MNGRGNPFVGKRPKTTNKFSIIWSAIIVVAPKARYFPKESFAFQAIQYPLQIKTEKRMIRTEIHKKRQDTIISEITVKMEEKREEVIDAMRKRKTLEILKDHHLLKKRKLQEKKDLSIQDEIASNLWGRNY